MTPLWGFCVTASRGAQVRLSHRRARLWEGADDQAVGAAVRLLVSSVPGNTPLAFEPRVKSSGGPKSVQTALRERTGGIEVVA